MAVPYAHLFNRLIVESGLELVWLVGILVKKMATVQKSPANPVLRERTPREIKLMKFINIFVLSFVAALLAGIVLCAVNGMEEIAFALGCVAVVMLWNYRVIRRKYARGL